MGEMYQHELHATRRRRHHYKLWIFIILVLIGGLVFWLHSLKPQTQVTTAKSITKTIASQSATKHWDEPIFSLDLPKDWVQAGPQTATHYHWVGGQKGIDDSRSLDVYADTLPTTLAVNRVLTIDANGPSVNVDGDVSANCSSFTGNGQHTPGEAPAPAIWNSQPFICDLANYERDAVGTISTQGVNTVILTGPSGPRHYFFVYTDDSYVIDYDIFSNALKSFQAK